MKKILLNQIVLIFVLFLTACNINASKNQNINVNKEQTVNTNNKKIETVEVAEHQVFCEQLVPRKCLFVKREGKKQFRALWDHIENFKYVPGYFYVLKVEVEKIPRPPKDTSGFRYYLKEIVSREKADSNVNENLYLSKWYLTHIKGKEIAGVKPFIVFQLEKEGFYGNTGCNSMSGKYKFENNSISFSRVRQTKRTCPNMQTVESPFTSILGEENEIKVESDRLYFKKNGIVILEFKSNWAE